MTLSDSVQWLAERTWQDTARSPGQRVDALIAAMTLREKVAQLHGFWVGTSPDGPGVAPHQSELDNGHDFADLVAYGLGQLTRAFGTNPVDAAEGAAALARAQREIAAANRFGIPALVHEECLAGFTTWGATAYPVPLSWGATFDPSIVREMAARIGAGMRAVGVHQGLAPVLDVVRDARWGRVEETIGEDPYLIGTIGSAYVQGLQSTGIVATLKHFAGYSASRAGRNLAPVSMGPREFADVVLPAFEMAVVEGGAHSVMHSYAEVDGVPAAANRALLTELLRDSWGFDGTVVADYFGISFLKLLHGVAGTFGQAAAQALTAGVDVELPGPNTYLAPLLDEIEAGRLDEAVVDRALCRVLRQKLDLGLLDADWSAVPSGLEGADPSPDAPVRGTIDLDPPADRELARRMAEEAIVLLKNDGLLPLADPRSIAVIGPIADDPIALLGCYSFPAHVGVHHPDLPLGVEIPTILEALRAQFPDSDVAYAAGCHVSDPGTDGFAAALDLAARSQLVIAVLGDRSGLFGRGTSGEGCDTESLELPGVQAQLLEALLDNDTPVLLVVDSGRPYALGTAPDRAAAIVQMFFPGEEGGPALARIISGAVNPSGRLPVSIPRKPGGQPWTYLSQQLALASEVSNLDPTPAYPFGTGCGYTTFRWSDLSVDSDELTTDGSVGVELTVENTGDREGVDVVQLYLHDPAASVTRPVVKLIGFARITAGPATATRVRFDIPASVTSFIGPDLDRIAEPGEIELRLGASSTDIRLAASVTMVGTTRVLDHTRERHCRVTLAPLGQTDPRPTGRVVAREAAQSPGNGIVDTATTPDATMRHRIGEVTVTVLGPDGRPLADSVVTVEQRRHAFAFGNIGFDLVPLIGGPDPDGAQDVESFGGAAHLDLDRFADLWLNLFNTATLPFYWGRYEPHRGSPDVRRLTKTAQWLAKRGVVVKGHPLVWHTVQPPWLLDLSLDEVERLQRARIRDLVSGFAGLIDAWDAINEAVIMPVFENGDNAITRLARARGRIFMVRMAFEEARAANPTAVLLLNDFDLSSAYECLIEGVLEAGITIDAIGLQTHMHQGYRGEEYMSRTLDRFARFGLPLHMTETSIVSGHLMPPDINDLNDYQIPDWPTTPDGEARQADDIVRHYRSLVRHPAVQSINYWGLTDDGAWLGAPIGLVRSDGSPKPSYTALEGLIKGEWWLPPSAMRTDADGRITVRGFLGDYAVTTTDGQAEFPVTAGATNVTVRISE
jgi:beta-xylosidase